ncbi:hypothetical protein Vadar_005136 [Vaccinium darrowii]|uniref:Uncharacterized protein n=1 Tax=Vaccinium darrowii TaxID=229202 RepID=A0ACB7WY62_9ERIC|nr:hypothetical protein Vadar_005136 [Vaccinium darrowii]
MSRNASRLIRSVAVHAHGSPRYFSTATVRTIATESASARILNGPGGVFHVVNPGKVSERAAATWIRLPVMGARSASTGALDAKDQKKVETGSAGGVVASGGCSDDKAIVSYWGISPGKVTKEDGSDWRWNSFRVRYISMSNINKLCSELFDAQASSYVD